MNAWILSLVLIFVPASDPAPPAQPPADDIDAQLLEGLEEGLDEAADKPADKPAEQPTDAPPQKPDPTESADPLDRELLDDLGDSSGEDAAPELPDADPLARLGRRMQDAQQLIGQNETGDQTQGLQDQIIKDLDELIRQARKKKSQSSSSSSGNKQSQGSRRSKPSRPGQGGQPGQSEGQPGDAPARDSTDRLGPNDNKQPDMGEMNDLVKGLWGQLPEKAREQMGQWAVEQFLPGYEELIEEYFRRLVEESEEKP